MKKRLVSGLLVCVLVLTGGMSVFANSGDGGQDYAPIGAFGVQPPNECNNPPDIPPPPTRPGGGGGDPDDTICPLG